MQGDRYECEATLHTEEAYMIDGYTFILLYHTKVGMLMQVRLEYIHDFYCATMTAWHDAFHITGSLCEGFPPAIYK